MDWDDVRPKPVQGSVLGEVLDKLSVAELEHRITALRAEITRVEAELAKKREHEATAAKLFKS